MNKILKISLIFCLAAACWTKAEAQDTSINITGTVVDSSGEPVIGANVIVKNRFGFGASTDANGAYKIKAGPDDILLIKFLGYEDQEIPVHNRTVIDVTLQEASEVIEVIAVSASGTQRKESVVGAITNVQMNDLNMPTANLSNMLAGNVGGIIAIQRSGEPGSNRSEFWIRGISTFGANAGALVLVDGIERELDEINPEDIQSFSVLKDASATAVYGQRGANGVVLITTKKGEAGKVNVNLKLEYGLKTPTRLPEYLSGPEYAALANEARASRYMDPLYDASDIEIINYHLDPDLYPNIDWYDQMLKKVTPTARAVVSLSGGGDNARYYLSGGYLSEGGLYNESSLKEYNTSDKYKRWNYRMNVDMNLSKTTILEVGIGGWLVNQAKPGAGMSVDAGQEANMFFQSLAWMTPVTAPIRYSNGQWPGFGEKSDQASPYVIMNETGWRQYSENKVETNIGVRQNLSFITKGLSLTGRFSFDSWGRHDIYRLRTPALYKAERVRDGLGQLITTRMVNQSDLEVSTYDAGTRRYYGEATLNYDRVFGKHRVGGLLFYYQQEQQSDDATDNVFAVVPRRNMALSGRVTYAFDDRYMLEFNFGYTGSENFEKGKQFGFFPAIAVGWLVSREKFIKDNAPWLSTLKFRYSYGEVGNDQIGGNNVDNPNFRFPYVTTIGTNGEYWFGNMAGSHMTGLGIATIGASNLTWEVARKHNLGVDLELFNRFSLTVDFFKDTRSNIFMRRQHLPGTVGLEGEGQNPWGNVGRMENKGFDGTMAYTQKIGEVAMTLRGNFTYARTKVLDYDEASNALEYQMSKGYMWRQNRGLIALGLFQDYDEIASSPTQYGVDLMPGDIKYKDVNGDGVVNDDDIVPLGYTPDPGIIYGVGLSLQWRGLDFNVLFQGAANRDMFIGGIGVFPFSNNEMGNVLSVVNKESNRWISREISGDPATERADAIFPRLAYGTNENNYRNSTYWLRDRSFVRLKNLEIGYTLPHRFTHKLKMGKARVYVLANNLVCWSPFKWWDPELDTSDGTRYPIQMQVTLGLNVSF